MSDAENSPGLQRGPIDAIRTTLRDGMRRYRSIKDAPETRSLITAFLLTWIASRMNLVALVVLSFQIGDGALGVGGMMAVTLLPLAIFQPLGGMLVDKFPGKNLLVITYLLFALLALSHLLLIPFANIWLLFLIRFLSGTIQSIEATAFEMRLMMVTPREKRGTANAVQAMGFEVGEIVGPLIGGAILALAGVAPIFIINAITLAFIALTVWRLPNSVPGAQREVEDDEEAAEEAAAAASGGYGWLLKRPEIVTYILLGLGSGLVGYGIMTAFVSKALEVGMNEGSVGVFFSVVGAGAFLSGMFAGMGEYTTRRALIITGLAASASASSVMLFGWSNTFLFAVITLFLYGLIVNIEEIPALTYFQNRLPETIYGRFFSTYAMAGTAGGFIGSLVVPFLIERNGVDFALTVVTIPGVVLGILFAIRGGGLQLRRPFLPSVASATTGFAQVIPLEEAENPEPAVQPILTGDQTGADDRVEP